MNLPVENEEQARLLWKCLASALIRDKYVLNSRELLALTALRNQAEDIHNRFLEQMEAEAPLR